MAPIVDAINDGAIAPDAKHTLWNCRHAAMRLWVNYLRNPPNLPDAAPPRDMATGRLAPPDCSGDISRQVAHRVQLFVNPYAGSWRCERVAALHAAFVAHGALVSTTSCREKLIAVCDDFDHVCAVGGDGTIREVVAALSKARKPPSVSVYPLGTINLLARERAYSYQPDTFVQRVLEHSASRHHHVASIDEAVMLTCASVGPDSRAIDMLSPRLKQLVGRAAYAVAFVGVLVRWRRHQLRIVSGNNDVSCEAVYVAKGRFFAGPWSFAPNAAVDDPLLHVVALRRATRTAFLAFTWDLFRRREPRNVIRFTCSELTIIGDKNVVVQADGDIIARLPVEIRISTGKLAFA